MSSTAEPSSERAGAPSASPALDLPTVVVAVVAAVVAAFSPAAPTGLRGADAVWCALLVGAVALAGSRARPGAVLWLTALCSLLAVRGPAPAVVVAFASLAAALVLIGFEGRRSAPPAAWGAVAGAATAAMLWSPSWWFTGFPSLVAAAAVLPVLVGGWWSLGARGRRRVGLAVLGLGVLVVVASVAAGLVALSLRASVTDAAAQARDGLALVRDGQPDLATPDLESAASSFRDAAERLDGPLGTAGRLIPVVGHQIEALQRVSAAGSELSEAAAAAAQEADYQGLRTEQGQVDLARVASMQTPVDRSLAAARHAREVVDEIRSPWLVAPLADKIDELDQELSETLPSVELAARALEVAPALLGAEGDQRYLLQFATPAESRAAGGYVGTYGVLRAADGRLDLELTGSTEDLAIPLSEEPRAFDPPPGWDELYSSFNVAHFPGNVTADPDWPTDSEVARQLYAQVDGVGPVDGVLYADPTALASLLELTGPVYVPALDRELSAQDVEQFLLVDQYVIYDSDDDATNLARRAVLGEVARAVFEAFSSRELPSLRSMMDVLGPTVDAGHLKLSVFDQQAEALFDDVGLSGAWAPTPGADYLSMRTTDLLSNKIDTFVDRSVEVRVDHDPGSGTVSSTVTVTLTNRAPTSGLPWYIIGNYSGLPAATSRDAVAIYSPFRLDGATVGGEEVEVLRQPYGSGNVYTVAVLIPAGEQRQLTMTLAGTVPAGLPYRIDLLPQPRPVPDRYAVTFVGEAGAASGFDGPLAAQTLVGPGRVG